MIGFRHATQGESESVGDFIRRLERTFHLAYGRDGMQVETCDALLYSQLQEGLRQQLMESPAVSGAADYTTLCIVSKNEERRQAALKRRRQYFKPVNTQTSRKDSGHSQSGDTKMKMNQGTETRKCYTCGAEGHIAKDCTRKKTESSGDKSKKSYTRKVCSGEQASAQSGDPLDYLYSSSDDEEARDVRQIRVSDKDSRPQCAHVQIQGVPAFGIIDSGADITIMGGGLFRKVASVAHLKKRDFKKADKTPRTYDQKPFHINGQMDLDVIAPCVPLSISRWMLLINFFFQKECVANSVSLLTIVMFRSSEEAGGSL